MRLIFVLTAFLVLIGPAGADVFRFKSRVDRANNDLFDESNWTPSGLVIDPGIPVNHDLIIQGSTVLVDLPTLEGTLELGNGSLSMSGGGFVTVRPVGANGIAANSSELDPPNALMLVDGFVEMATEFLHDIDLTIRGEGGVTLEGGVDSLTRSTLHFETGRSFVFINGMTRDFFMREHFDDVTVYGRPAVLNRNVGISTGGPNIQVFAIPEPTSPSLVGISFIAIVCFGRSWGRTSNKGTGISDTLLL